VDQQKKNPLSLEEMKQKIDRLCAALEYYAVAEKVLVTHKPKDSKSAMKVKITRPDNGEVARAALEYDPQKESIL
jgi:hypothetical protein